MEDALTDATYLILLALLKPQHGYAIMKQVHEISQGSFEIGPATMYTILKKLTKKEWIILDETADRKKIYRITQRGKEVLENDILRRKLFYDIGAGFIKQVGGSENEKA
ncbi:PadR family transcriptional regulator [Enterococcus sp. DIV0876]|uniref:PadR family transcriptional regulator n=1 Tax=Enterococcus sp. DIV0876 TaxID=2774633 RepID=UPI003D300119